MGKQPPEGWPILQVVGRSVVFRFLRSLSANPTWFDAIRSNVAPQTGHFSANSSRIATLQLPHRMVRRSTRREAVVISVLIL